ncbi:ketopantoate reductase family protein [Methylobacterium nonmethylotrophicum]|uniref:2-dehydropantoate 2-reductase n=1 Tax=Methylobacterium nonmethylotrophicum TaxID=1141884 RepID=A0A4Z0NPC1_9HYPH|nr:2-dehydropantoate 2-reductase [Methylobacterium nonmethylotrophicum]TGD98671.1 2-dehydropantoate 2-reductase [Methylobacterium nonmethylotrophicum]
MAKVAIVGCGAMGSVYAALMTSAGHAVHAVTLWPDHAAAMREKGLRVEGASGDRTVRLASAGTTTEGIGACDLVIIATKAFDVAAAARSCAPLIGEATVVQTIQNGLGSPETAATVIDPDRIAVGVVGGFGASMRGPGHAHHNGLEMIRFGAFAGLPRARLEASAAVWESAGFTVRLFDDIGRMVWEKLIMNVTFSGTTTLTGLTIGGVMADPDAWQVAQACAREAIAVAGAMGIALDVGDPVEHIRRLGGKIPDARPSMLLDHRAGRRGEVEAINGSIPRLGRAHGVPTPVNATVVALIKAREALLPPTGESCPV